MFVVHIQDGLVEATTSTLDQLNVIERNLIASINLATHSFTKVEKSLIFTKHSSPTVN